MRLGKEYYSKDAVALAKDMLGKTLVRRFGDGTELRAKITEVEAYCGAEDLACHASKGRTRRTEVMYKEGGRVYVYLIYGMYWMLNFVSGKADHPQAVLIRSIENVTGPGRVGKVLRLDKSFYGEDLMKSDRIWVEKEPDVQSVVIRVSKRIGIDYAGEFWANKPWRFFI
ncbi:MULTISPECIES: DNA-3-methyladenine glycosylase [unclassified Saccharicrinis]|uniref:DNA-3-methyladenine glycosylase n=1 Tax=unclassified Saccharicrinis TaxID=2646859 RepID=UPI003D34EEF3